MAIISIPNTFSAGAVIVAAQHNSNFSTIYSDYNGNIDNSNISSAAAIAYSKLNLALSIVNADISTSAGIVGSKLNLTSPGAIGGTTPAAGAFSTLKVGTTNQGDVLYDNGTTFVRLTPGTSGQFLQTNGASANPSWGPGSFSHSEFLARLLTAATNAYDLTGGFTTGTDFAASTFTAPTTGKYMFNLFLEFTKDATATLRTVVVQLKVGSNVVANFTKSTTLTSDVFTIGGSILLSLTAADAVTTVTALPGGVGAWTVSDITKSYFSGHLIR